MKEVAALITTFAEERPVVVLSALGKTTNKLLAVKISRFVHSIGKDFMPQSVHISNKPEYLIELFLFLLLLIFFLLLFNVLLAFGRRVMFYILIMEALQQDHFNSILMPHM
jgi:hypothetical protein